MFFKKHFALVVILLLFGLGACRPQEVDVEAPPGTAAPDDGGLVAKTVSVTRVKTVQVIATPTAVPDGGVVVRTAFDDAKTLNPLLASDPWSSAACALMFEGLLTVDAFTGEFKPNFAQGWVVSADGLVYTFTLRPGLFWSDGAPITAHDFAFTYQALLSGKLETPHNRLVSNVRHIRVIADDIVEVVFFEPDCANLVRLNLGWLPMHVFTRDAASFDFSELNGHEFNSRPMVFSGPFGLTEWVRDDYMLYTRNARYWRGAPHLEGIRTQIVSGQSDLVRMLKRGEADIGVGIDPQYLAGLEQVSDLDIFKFVSDEYDFIGFQLGDPNDPQPRLNPDGALNRAHGAHPILHDKRVRQAIVYALDRQAIVDQARMGQGILLHTNVLPTISWAYYAGLEPREYDLDRARQLLEQAGWTLDPVAGVRVKNGRPLHLRLYTNSGNAVRETIGYLVKQQLKEVGIEVELITVEWNAFLDILFGQTFDMVIASWTNLGVNPDDGDLWRAENDLPGQGNNFVSYYNPGLSRDLDRARTAPGCDQDVRAEIFRRAQAQLYEDQPYCWIDVPRRLVVVRDRVGGVNFGPWNVWYNVHEWYVNQEVAEKPRLTAKDALDKVNL